MTPEQDTLARTPTATEIARFVELFGVLASFEAVARHNRGWGAFGPETTIPDPDVVKVISWLKELASRDA